MPSMNRRSKLTAAAVVATVASAGVEAFSPVAPRTNNGASMSIMKNKAAASALRMSTADDEVAKLRAAAQKAREEAQALAKVSLPLIVEQAILFIQQILEYIFLTAAAAAAAAIPRLYYCYKRVYVSS